MRVRDSRLSVCTWNSTAITVATVSGGTVQGVEPGATTVRATFGGKSAEVQVAVTDATLVTLSLSPNSPAIAPGTSQPFTVEGYFSDGTFQPITGDVEWASSDTGVATITGGTALGVAPGQTTISVTFEGKSASTVMTVTSATLQSLEITGAQSIAKGTSTPLTLTGHFSDGTRDLTSAATWSSDSTSASVVQGVVHGEAVESNIEITAIYDGQTASHTLSVTDAVAVSLRVETVTVNAPTLFNIGGTLGLKATAVFSDGSDQVVTNDAAWSSSSTNVATVSTNGVVTGLAAGQSDISATYDGKTGTLRVTAQVAPLPDLVLQSGAYTFNTETGVLSQGGTPIPNIGWNSTDQRLVLNSLTINTGATLTLAGANPFKVRATEQITINGQISGRGVTGTSGNPGSTGKEVILFCGGDLTGTGIIQVSGGDGDSGPRGGNGGRLVLTTAGELSGLILQAKGGFGGSNGGGSAIGGIGGSGGEIFLHSQGTLFGNTINGNGGEGGMSRTRSGNGGKGGKISLHSQDTLSDNTISGDGGDGGFGLGGDGGDGGDGGEISLHSQGTLSDNTISGDGGDGGFGLGNGGNGGTVVVSLPIPTSGISVGGGGAGSSSSGGINGNPGANGTINGVQQ